MKIKNLVGSATLLTSILLCSVYAGSVSAESAVNTQENLNNTNTATNKLSQIETNNYISIDSKKALLYPTFVNPESAIAEIQKKTPDFLNAISKKYALEQLGTENWNDYRNYADQYVTEDSNLSELEIEQYNALNNFFDIYENADKNTAIADLVMKSTLSRSASDTTEMALLLPYTSDLSTDFNNAQTLQGVGITATLSSVPNLSNSIAYASNYAVNPNRNKYPVFGQDCTNFASQILEAGGVSQSVFTDTSKGWWHTIGVTQYGQIYHTNSISWSVADTFARYMGVGYTSKSHSSFSSAIAQGDFIAADFEGDGDWNHIGFVTAKGSYANYGGKSYTDYKVAQHTNNYHDWTSSSTNGWETVEDGNGTYGRVRR